MRTLTPSKTAQMVAVSVALVALTACGSSGSIHSDAGPNPGNNPGPGVENPGGENPGGTPPTTTPPTASNPDPATSALQTTVQQTAKTVGSVSGITDDVGDLLGNVLEKAPLLAGTAAPTSTVLQEVGNSVDALSAGLHNGLGKIGSIDDPVGTTLSSLEGTVVHAGAAVSGVGDIVKGAGSQLTPLNGVTNLAGGAVNQLGGVVDKTGQAVGHLTASAPVQQVTQGASNLVTPLLTKTVGVVQATGSTTGVGVPIQNLLTTVGGIATTVGVNVQGTQVPVVAPTGNLVAEVGRTVSALGGLTTTTAPGSSSTPTQGVGAILGGGNGGLLNGGLLGNDGVLGNVLGAEGGLLAGKLPVVEGVVGGSPDTNAPQSPPLLSGILNGGLLGNLLNAPRK